MSASTGTYSGAISAELALTVGCKRNVRPEMAELKGKRLVVAAELEEGMRLNTSIVKQLCSTDEVSAEKKYKDPFKYVPTHTLVLYTNHLPKVGANDNGTWRNLLLFLLMQRLPVVLIRKIMLIIFMKTQVVLFFHGLLMEHKRLSKITLR